MHPPPYRREVHKSKGVSGCLHLGLPVCQRCLRRIRICPVHLVKGDSFLGEDHAPNPI